MNTIGLVDSVKEVLNTLTGVNEGLVTNINNLVDIKEDIKKALKEQGIEPSDKFVEYADNIRAIKPDSNSEEVEYLKSQISELQRELLRLKTTNVTLQESVNSLNTQVNTLNTQIDELSATNKGLQEANKKLEDANIEIGTMIAKILG
jgi:chromosome segregation ATPase